MLEKMLSRSAFKLYIAVFIVIMIYVAWMRFTNSGLIVWIDWLQTVVFSSDYYYAEVSFMLLMIPAIAISFGIGLLFDRLTGQGIFARHAQVTEDLDPGAFLTYRQAHRADVIQRVRAKYEASIRQLMELGFSEPVYYRESVARLGLGKGLLGLTGVVGFLGNEVTTLGPNLAVSAYFPVLTSREYSTFASVIALGTSFFTLFTDGTCLISSNFQGIVLSDAEAKLHKKPVSRSLPNAWQDHVRRIEELRAQGKTIRDDLSLSSFIGMSKRVDDYGLRNTRRVMRDSKSGPSTGSMVVSSFVSMGVLVAVVFAFILLPNLLANLLPACDFVKNMKNFPLWLNALLVPACLGFSWAISRLRHNDLFTLNGTGPQMFGQQRIEGTNQYLSTKWLALPYVPLLPVRSYLLTIEDSGPVKGEVLGMQPQEEINWEQVRDTVRRSWLAYLIFALLLLAFPAWAYTRCM